MEALFSWLSNLINFFGNFIPRLRICKKNYQGVKYVRGKNVKIISPGLFMYWPLTTEFDLTPVAPQILNLTVQTLLTKDNKTIIGDGCVCYKIADVEKYLVDNYDSPECLNQVALASVRDVIMFRSLDDIQNDREEIDECLTESAKELLEDQFGVQILYVKLVSCAPARVINLVGGLGSSLSLYNDTPNKAAII